MSYHISYEPADLLVHVQGKGIVCKEKSLIAFQKSDDKIVACGTAAEQMTNLPEKDRENIVIMSPLRQGMVAEYAEAVALFSYLLREALGKKPLFKPAVAVCIPKGITATEQKAMEEVMIQSGAGELFIADIPAEQFIREFPEKFPKESRKFKITIGITKEEPERYIEERLKDILTYARQEEIPLEKISGMLQMLQQ